MSPRIIVCASCGRERWAGLGPCGSCGAPSPDAEPEPSAASCPTSCRYPGLCPPCVYADRRTVHAPSSRVEGAARALAARDVKRSIGIKALERVWPRIRGEYRAAALAALVGAGFDADELEAELALDRELAGELRPSEPDDVELDEARAQLGLGDLADELGLELAAEAQFDTSPILRREGGERHG